MPKIDFIEVFCFFPLTVQHHDNKKEAAGVKLGCVNRSQLPPVVVEITAEGGPGQGGSCLFGGLFQANIPTPPILFSPGPSLPIQSCPFPFSFILVPARSGVLFLR